MSSDNIPGFPYTPEELSQYLIQNGKFTPYDLIQMMDLKTVDEKMNFIIGKVYGKEDRGKDIQDL